MRFLSALILIFTWSQGLADTKLAFDDGSNVWISQGRVLFGDDESGFLYSGTGNAMTAIEWRDETYMVIDEQFTSEVSDQMDAAMAQMQEQLAQLPPEQRAMMQEMLKDSMPAMAGSQPQKRSYRATGKKNVVAGFKCSEGEVLLNGRLEQQLCTSSPRELGMPDEDYAALRAAFSAMASVAKEFRDSSELVLAVEAMEGIPVSSRRLDGSKESSRLVSVSNEKINAGRMTVPDHFVEIDPRRGM